MATTTQHWEFCTAELTSGVNEGPANPAGKIIYHKDSPDTMTFTSQHWDRVLGLLAEKGWEIAAASESIGTISGNPFTHFSVYLKRPAGGYQQDPRPAFQL